MTHEGWRNLRLKSLVSIVGGGTPAADAENWDGDIPFVTPPDLRLVHGGLCMQTERYLTAAGARAGSTVVDGGAVLVSKRAPIGYVSQVAMRVAFNQGCLALVPRASVDPSFLTWALSVRSDEMNVLGRGTTFMEISAGDLGKIRVRTPSVYEQRQIAAFLDRETAKIDALIGKQEQLIETLGERRAAVVDRGVWKGLSGVPCVASAVEPAPESPAHWGRVRNRALLQERTDLSVEGAEELLSVSHITGVTPRSEKTINMIEAESWEGYRLVSPGDLVINTMWAWMGALGTSDHAGIVSPAYGVYRPRSPERYDPRYFHYLYRSTAYVAEMTRHSRGIWSSRLRLYPEAFLRLPVVVPPLAEQQAIADYLDDQTSKINLLTEQAQRFIALLKERRSALISAVVTGQIDVRGEVDLIDETMVDSEDVA